jgi:hypothetical protein
MVAPDLRVALDRLAGLLQADGDTLVWQGPPAILKAGDREVLARVRPAIVAALRGGLNGGEVYTGGEPGQPGQAPERITEGPYAGFALSPAGRTPDPVRAAVAILEALAWRLQNANRDRQRREAIGRRRS